ncbi:hypothetical protein B7P43_G00672 [Cryptotermes secundus]|nr:hypothetical protein B7P43_G00672 [Cryptotermes secundus]
MTTETEKLKKRLELMSKELSLHQRKLRRHIRKKEVKLNDKKAKFTKNSSHCTIGTIAKHPCVLEISALEKCNKGLVSSLSKHNFIYSSDSKDEARGVSVGATLPHSHSIHIASEPKIIQKNVSREEHVCATVVPELASQQYFPVLGEENSSLKQSDITNKDIGPTISTDCKEAPTYSTYSTPRKLISNENDSNWSPILTQKNCVSKSSAKPRTSFIEKRKKCLLSSTKSKKKYIHKQTSFTLNHEMLHKVKNALPLDSLAAPGDITSSESTRVTHTDDTLLVREDTVYKKPERNGFVTFPPCVAKGRVLSVIFEDSFLVLVQEFQISLWRFFKRKAPCWFHIGVLPRKLLDCGISVGCMSRKVNFGSEQMFVCIELWTSDAEEQTILTCVIYSYNTIERTFKSCCVEFKHIQW